MPPGHLGRVGEVRRHLAERGGLAVAGNYLDGVGIEGAVASGEAAADAVWTTTLSASDSKIATATAD